MEYQRETDPGLDLPKILVLLAEEVERTGGFQTEGHPHFPPCFLLDLMFQVFSECLAIPERWSHFVYKSRKATTTFTARFVELLALL